MNYTTYRQFLKEKFGGPVRIVPINGGFSCPNRDGTYDSEGCFFCDNRSFSPVAHRPENVVQQLEQVIMRGNRKWVGYIPYLQPFSNTYGDISMLKAVYEPLIAHPQSIGLSVGTRPDCFGHDTLEYLVSVAERTWLTIELGLQSIHNNTLQSINRGHTVEDFIHIVHELHKHNIYTVAHVILGLPGEGRREMLQTAELISSLPVNGVKIHQLTIISGTRFDKLYRENRVSPLHLSEYAEICAAFVGALREDQHIHRMMADAQPQNGLVAPLWSSKKADALKIIAAKIKKI